MPSIKLQKLGEIGLIKDIPQQDIPVNAWAESDRVEFNYGVVRSNKGYSRSTAIGSLSTTPHFILTSKDVNDTDYLVYASNTKIFGFLNSTHTNLTRTAAGADFDYSASSFNAWQACHINGNLILNNGSDIPQFWLSASSTPRFANLTGWSSTWRANSIRSFNNYLIAVNIKKDLVNLPQMVKWSTSASAGAIPISWDELSLTLDAGEVELADSPDHCVDSLQLRDAHIIYKEFSTWGMRFIGFPNIFQFYKIFGNSGIMAKNCVGELDDKHYVLTQTDFIVHDGNSFRSLIDQILKDYIFSNLDAETKVNCFVHINTLDKLVILGLPFASTYPNTLLIYDTRFNTFSKYGITPIYNIAGQGSITTGATWDSDSGIWDNDSSIWNDDATLTRLLLAGKEASPSVLAIFNSTLAESASFTATLSREGLSFIDSSFEQTNETVKRINYILPDISSSTGVNVIFEVGTKQNYYDTIDWGTPRTYTIGTSNELWFFATGRYFGFRISSISQDSWELKSMNVDIQPVGTYF